MNSFVPISYLFVPASRPDRISKALRSQANAVIVDLEDSVPPQDKVEARRLLRALSMSAPVHLRINAWGSPFIEDDLRLLDSITWVSSVIMPKVEEMEDVHLVRSALNPDISLVASIETAKGLEAAELIARSGVERLVFGSVDYTSDVDMAASAPGLAYPRSRLVVASRAAGLPAPIDGPCLSIAEGEVWNEAQEARALGLGGKLCIHPRQVKTVNDAFAPSAGERRWARALLDAAARHDGGAFLHEGAMVDEPVLVRARRVLDTPR